MTELEMRTAEVEALRSRVQTREQRLVTEAFKDDSDKPRMDLVPHDAVREVAKVMTYGARKYSPDNWRKGMAWNRPVAAALRHINAWQSGINTDEESGLPHLAHAIVGLMFALVYQLRGIGEDDRW